MDAIEAKIEAIKALFEPFDREVEIRICSHTENYDDGRKNKYYACEVLYFDEDWNLYAVDFVADKNTEKVDGVLASISPCDTGKNLITALDKLYNRCVDAIQRKYVFDISPLD